MKGLRMWFPVFAYTEGLVPLLLISLTGLSPSPRAQASESTGGQLGQEVSSAGTGTGSGGHLSPNKSFFESATPCPPL